MIRKETLIRLAPPKFSGAIRDLIDYREILDNLKSIESYGFVHTTYQLTDMAR